VLLLRLGCVVAGYIFAPHDFSEPWSEKPPGTVALRGTAALQMRALGEDRRRGRRALAQGRLAARAKSGVGGEATWHARSPLRAPIPAGCEKCTRLGIELRPKL